MSKLLEDVDDFVVGVGAPVFVGRATHVAVNEAGKYLLSQNDSVRIEGSGVVLQVASAIAGLIAAFSVSRETHKAATHDPAPLSTIVPAEVGFSHQGRIAAEPVHEALAR